ncbi:OmpA family protein [Vibrio gangliei]|uniref:OmpA family protein n=1 Tax=Vibrio gangliei TaxID=2077090 RepID=UPI000D016F62|nr:OmpA family protein [Vibrio gangliei]
MNIKRISLYPSVASIISLSLLMSPQVNAAAENAGEFYLGAKTGWSYFSGFCDPKEGCDDNSDDDAWGGSVYGGYQFNNWLSLEGGYNYLGNAKTYFAAEDVKSKIQNGELGLKADWNLGSAWNLFGKAGTSYNDIEHKSSIGESESDNNWSLMLGAGLEYQLSHNWRVRTEYQWFDDVGSSSVGDTDVHYVSLGLSYYFGSSDKGAAATAAAAATTAAMVQDEPMVEAEPAPEPLPAATLSKGAFGHDSTELTPEAKSSLDPVVTYLDQRQDVNVTVTGYTDSTGSAEYNQKLSEQRAQKAADYLTANGVDSSRVTVEGKGEADPIADNSTAEGREQNRRVEIHYVEAQ